MIILLINKDIVNTAKAVGYIVTVPNVVINIKGIPFLGPIIPIINSGSNFGIRYI